MLWCSFKLPDSQQFKSLLDHWLRTRQTSIDAQTEQLLKITFFSLARHKIPKKSLHLHQLLIFDKIPWKARAPAVQYLIQRNKFVQLSYSTALTEMWRELFAVMNLKNELRRISPRGYWRRLQQVFEALETSSKFCLSEQLSEQNSSLEHISNTEKSTIHRKH